MKEIQFLKYIHKDELHHPNIISDENQSDLTTLGIKKKKTIYLNEYIKWFEMPYIFNHIEKSKKKDEYEINKTSRKAESIIKDDLSCIFIRPSLSNLLEDIYNESLIKNNYRQEDGGNEIYYLTRKMHKNILLKDLINKKRLSRVRKGEKSNNLLILTISELLKGSYFEQVAKTYQELMRSKNVADFYLFNRIWESPESLSLIRHKFFLGIDKNTGSLNGFVITINSFKESFIFLSASSKNGKESNVTSFLRYNVINEFITNENTDYLNMGGVNTKRGGDDSFKRSFGGEKIRYKIYYQADDKYYYFLNKMGIKFDSNKILFWK